MTSFMAVQLPSEDEEDLDFVPDEVDSDDERAKKKEKKTTKRIRGVVVNGDDDEIEKRIGDVKAKKQKERVHALWNELQGRETKTVDMEAFSRPMDMKKTKNKKTGDEEWKRQLGLGGTKKQKSEKKSTADIAARALEAVKEASSAGGAAQRGMITIEETRRFAGGHVRIQRDVDKGSKEAEKLQKQAAEAETKKAGLDAVLETIAPAKKVTVMDKSKSDWKEFKSTDQEIHEELEAHKKSGATYLDKKEFLSKADYAEYERERDRRLAQDVRNRGRL